ncbi:MAG TPA: hypothetical protein VGP26_24540 [Actinophytocola sp.]|jgi:hypothetical protein|nr:hypothetical protein [Actinophytocola sp.]
MAHDRRDGQTVYKLVFPDRPGLTVRVRRASLAGMIDLAEATPVLRRNAQRDEARTELENLHAWRRIARAFASALLEWDLFDGGAPVSATFAGVMTLELDEIMALVQGWRQAMAAPVQFEDDEPDEGLAPGLGDEPPVDELDEEWLAQLPAQVAPEPVEQLVEAVPADV